jgi:hypothetical protein
VVNLGDTGCDSANCPMSEILSAVVNPKGLY